MLGLDAIVITGSSCAGKTTVAHELAKRFDGPTALVQLDAVRGQIISGALSVWAPFPPTTEALDQWAAAIDICGDMCRRYRDRSWFSIVDAPGVYTDDNPWEPFQHAAWAAALEGVAWRLVVLHPTLGEVERRASIRRGEPAEGDVRLAGMHGAMEAWRGRREAIIVDPTNMDVDETAAAVLAGLGGASSL